MFAVQTCDDIDWCKTGSKFSNCSMFYGHQNSWLEVSVILEITKGKVLWFHATLPFVSSVCVKLILAFIKVSLSPLNVVAQKLEMLVLILKAYMWTAKQNHQK